MTKNLLITKDNVLIHVASSNLSVNEQRIISLCLAKWDSREKIPDNREFIITVDDFCTDIGVSKDAAHKALDEAVKNLYERTIFLDPNNPDSQMRWLAAKIYRKQNSEISLYFSQAIIPLISGLENCFTSYKLKDIVQFECSYSVRFYELLMSWKNKNEIKVDVIWIREVLQLGNKYPDFYDLKKRVILPALADINKSSNLNVSYEQIKKGKVIWSLIFKYGPKKIENKIPKKLTKKYIQDNAKPGETWEEATNRLTKKLQAKP